jgi:hypothetical protein
MTFHRHSHRRAVTLNSRHRRRQLVPTPYLALSQSGMFETQIPVSKNSKIEKSCPIEIENRKSKLQNTENIENIEIENPKISFQCKNL